MIQGVKMSQIQLIRQNLFSHHKKINQIKYKSPRKPQYIRIKDRILPHSNQKNKSLQKQTNNQTIRQKQNQQQQQIQHKNNSTQQKQKIFKKNIKSIIKSNIKSYKNSNSISHNTSYSNSLNLSLKKISFNQTYFHTFNQHQIYQNAKQHHAVSMKWKNTKRQAQIQHQNQIMLKKLMKIEKRNKNIMFNNTMTNNINNQTAIQTKDNTINNEFNKSQKKIKSIFTSTLTNHNNNISFNTDYDKYKLKNGKDYFYRKKLSLAIDATNVQIGKKILNQTGYISHSKDMKDFNKNRQILHRLEKFNLVNKLLTSPPKKIHFAQKSERNSINQKSKRTKTLPSKLPKIEFQTNQITQQA